MMDENESTYFDLLPDKIGNQIFNELSLAEKKQCRLVSKRWNQILDEWSHNLVFHSTLSNESQSAFFNSNLRMNSAVMKNKKSRMPRKPTFPYIRHAIIGWKNSAGNIENFLKHGIKNSESLTIKEHSLEKMSNQRLNGFKKLLQVKGRTWKNLTQLKVYVNLPEFKWESAAQHLDAVVVLFNSVKISTIKEFEFHLHVSENTSDERDLQFQNLCFGFYKFLTSHAKLLKILKCTMDSDPDRPSRSNIPELPDSLRQSNLNLTSAHFRLWGVSQLAAMLSPILFGSQLQNLYLQCGQVQILQLGPELLAVAQDLSLGTGANIDVLNQNLEQIIANNSTSLKTIQFYDFPVVSLESLKTCCGLVIVCVRNMKHGEPTQSMSPRTIEISPINIFEASSKSIRHISLKGFEVADFSWFINCLNLETLEIIADFGVGRGLLEQRKQKLPHMPRLKKLDVWLKIMKNQNAVDEIQQLFSRCEATLEDLRFRVYLVGWKNICFRDCSGIKKLEIWGFLNPECFMTGTIPNNFPNLTVLRTDFCTNAKGLADWMIECMPNLEKVGNIRPAAFEETVNCVPYIKNLLRMLSKLKRISVFTNYWSQITDPTEIFYNENPGVKIVVGKDEDFPGEISWIEVDRSVYVADAQ